MCPWRMFGFKSQFKMSVIGGSMHAVFDKKWQNNPNLGVGAPPSGNLGSATGLINKYQVLQSSHMVMTCMVAMFTCELNSTNTIS